MFYGYNDGSMGLAWYEEDLEKEYLEAKEAEEEIDAEVQKIGRIFRMANNSRKDK